MESETILILSVFGYMKIHWSMLLFEWIFYPCIILVTSWTGLLRKKIVHWVMQMTQMLTFYYTISKITNLIRKIFKYWEAIKLTMVDIKFLRILIFIYKLVFYYQKKILPVVFLEVTVSLCTCLRRQLPNNYNLYVSPFKWKWCYMKKMARSAGNSNNCTSAVSGNNLYTLVCSRHAFCFFISLFRQLEYQKDVYWRVNI